MQPQNDADYNKLNNGVFDQSGGIVCAANSWEFTVYQINFNIDNYNDKTVTFKTSGVSPYYNVYDDEYSACMINEVYKNGWGVLETTGKLDATFIYIDGGTLRYKNTQATGNIYLSDGTLELDNSALNGCINANGGEVLISSGTVTFNSSNIAYWEGESFFYSNIKVNGGTLKLEASNIIAGSSSMTVTVSKDANLIVTGNTDSVGNEQTLINLNGNGNIYTDDDYAHTVKLAGDSDETFEGVISDTNGGTNKGSINIIKEGFGSLTLTSGENKYTGGTKISGEYDFEWGYGSTLFLGASSTVDEKGIITKGPVGTGKVTMDGGALGAIDGNITLDNQIVAEDGGAFMFDIGSTLTVTNALTNIDGTSTTTAGLLKMGSGTLILGKTNNYTGDTTIDDGTIVVVADNALGNGGTVTINQNSNYAVKRAGIVSTTGDSKVAINNNITANDITEGVTTAKANFATDDTSELTVTGNIVDNATTGDKVAVNKTGTGTLVLKGSNTYTGTTNVNTGTLKLSTTNAIANSTGVSVSDTAKLVVSGADSETAVGGLGYTQSLQNLSGDEGSTLTTDDAYEHVVTLNTSSSAESPSTFAGTISNGTIEGGKVTIVKEGAGVQVLSNENSTYSGGTTVSAGTLVINGGAITNPETGTVLSSPIGTGKLTLTGGSTLALGEPISDYNLPLLVNEFASTVTGDKNILRFATNQTSASDPAIPVITLAGDETFPDNFDLSTLAASVALPTGTPSNLHGVLELSGDKKSITVRLVESKINDATGLHYGDTLEEAYGQRKDSTQALTVYKDIIEGTSSTAESLTGTTVLNNDSNNKSTLTLSSSDSNTKTITGKENTTIIQNNTENSTTDLTLNNVNLVANGDNGLAIDAQNVILSGNASVDKSSMKNFTVTGDGTKITLNDTFTDKVKTETTHSDATIETGAELSMNDSNKLDGRNINLNGGTLGTTDTTTFDNKITLANNTTSGFNVEGADKITTISKALTTGEGDNKAGIKKTGEGTLVLNGTNTYTGETTIDNGKVVVGADNALGNGGTVTMNDSNGIVGTDGETIASINNGITTNAQNGKTETANFANNDTSVLTVTGNVTNSTAGGETAINKTGTGTLILNGTNTYTGGTTISQGKVVAGNNEALGSGDVTLDGGTLGTNNNNSVTLNEQVKLTSGKTSGFDTAGSNSVLTLEKGLTQTGTVAGSFDKTGEGTLVLTQPSNYTGNTTVANGTLKLTGTEATHGTLGSGTITTDGTDPVTGNPTTGTIEFAYDSGTINVSNVINGKGNVVKSEAGTVNVNSVQNYIGSTTISGGTLNLSVAGAINKSTNVTNNADLDTTGKNTLHNLNGTISSADVSINDTLTLETTGSTPSSYVGTITGPAAVEKTGTGTQILSNKLSTYSGGTTVSAGTLVINGGAITDSTTGEVLSSPIGTGKLTLTGGSTLAFGEPLSVSNLPLLVNDFASTATGNKNILRFATSQTSVTDPAIPIITLAGGEKFPDNFDLSTLVASVALPTGASGKLHGVLELSEDKKSITVRLVESNINDDAGLHYGDTLQEAYEQRKDSTQDLTVYVDTNEGKDSLSGTTVLNNDSTTNTSTLTLSSFNSETKTITGKENTAIIQNNTENSTTDLTLNNVNLVANGDNGQAIDAQDVILSGNASVDKSSMKDLTVTGDGTKITLSGTFTDKDKTETTHSDVNIETGAELSIDNSNKLDGRNINLNGGTLGTTATTEFKNQITLKNDTTSKFNVEGADETTTITNPLTTSGADNNAGIEKLGAGTLVLNGEQTYTGETTVNEGTLELKTKDAIKSSSGLVNNATVVMDDDQELTSLSGNKNGEVQTNGQKLWLNIASEAASKKYEGKITNGTTNTGEVEKKGTGTITLTNEDSTYGDSTHGTTVSDGTLVIDGQSKLNDDGSVKSSPVGVGPLTIKGGATVEIGDNAKPNNELGKTGLVISNLDTSDTTNGKNQLTTTSSKTGKNDTEILFTSTNKSLDLTNLNLGVTLPAGTDGSLYGALSQDSDGNVIMTLTEANVNDVARVHHGNTLEEAYDQKKDSTQNLVLYGSTTERVSTSEETAKGIIFDGTTVLNNDETTDKSVLNLSSDGTRRTISGKDQNTPIMQNTTGSTELFINNMDLEGYVFNATGQTLTLSGKNITMRHKSNVNDSDTIVTANTFIVEDAEVTFGSTIVANTEIENSTVNVGTGTTGDDLTVQGDLTVDGMVINLDVFTTGTSTDLNDAFVVDGNINSFANSTINLNWSGSGTPSLNDTIAVKFSATNGSDYEDAIVNSIRSYYFQNFKYEQQSDGSTNYWVITGSVNPNAVPEPSTWALLILGMAGLMWYRKIGRR